NAPAGTDYVCMTVIDDGSGMEKETIENIFKPFFTTKFVGRGLGMSAAYGIVKNHNGFIYVESKVERGSTVTVFLPIHSDPETPQP
ncbi:MAG: ATP-binding protein, partial [Desulfobacterales bacterium]|nr:ATP-binding protein [Desulfobacterales bacterium]